jgi:hypothetical protein
VDVVATGLDDAARRRIEDEAKVRAQRAADGARLRLDRARKLLGEAQKTAAADPGVERLFARADQAANAAQRLVMREAWREPASATPWPARPETWAKEGRLLRAEIATCRAVREVAGGRYDFGARLARRAGALDATNTEAPKLLEQAELGLSRLGVLRGSPAPTPK